MYFADIVTTIEDLEKLYYSQAGAAFLNQEDVNAPFITKSDAPITTGVTGVYQAHYGAQAWIQLNMESNTFGVLPKAPWGRSGYRVITARSTTLPYGGVGQAGDLPESVQPTFAQVSTLPKTHASVFENSEVHEFLATSGGDDAIAKMDDLRRYYSSEHREDMNAALNVQNGTTASNNLESIDRVCGSNAEKSNCKENDESTAYSTNDLDMYGSSSFDRDSAASWRDAYVSHNSSTVRSLTDAVIQTVLQNTLTNGANGQGQFWQTGWDTWTAINQVFDPQARYELIGKTRIAPSVNGISTPPGQNAGYEVSTLHNRATIISKDTVKDTGGISRLFLLDTSNPEGFDLPRLCLKVAKPTQYFEAGMNNNMPFTVGKFTTKGMFRTMAELICTFFAAQGKARDLKS